MFDLTLTPEQLEMRDTLRDFAQREMKAAAIHPDRLQPFEKPVMTNLLTGAAQLGIRTLALSEEAGGAGADNLTTCIVLEELASGAERGAGIRVVVGETTGFAHTADLSERGLAETARVAAAGRRERDGRHDRRGAGAQGG